MTRDQDIERVLDRWFTEGPTQMPNRFLDDTLDRIDGAPQHRLARLQTRLPTMHPNLRLAAAAAVVLAVAGLGAALLTQTAGIGRPSADVNGPLPASIQAEWQSVGTRIVPGPGPGGINTYALGILVDPTAIDIQNAHTDVVNSAKLVAPDRFEVKAITMGDFWRCAVGDVGLYRFSLTARDQQLTLMPVSDACAARAAVLAGDWSRTDIGPLQPGRHEATHFRPFSYGTTGQLAYTVPDGWAGGAGMNDGLFELGRSSGSDSAGITLISNAYASDQVAPCNVNGGAAGVGRTPEDLTNWLRTLPGLVVSAPTEVTIGGLRGVAVDLFMAPGWTPTCEAGLYTFSLSGSDGGDWSSRLRLTDTTRARYILLDRGDGSSLVVNIEAPDNVWNTFITDAMPIVQGFEFTP